MLQGDLRVLGFLALPLVGAAVVCAFPPALSRIRLQEWITLITAMLSAGLLLHVAGGTRATDAGMIEVVVDWIPSLDLSLAFTVDRLSLFFAGNALCIGVLVALYAIPYFHDQKGPHRRFHVVLLGFMTVMAGAVCADHVLVLYILWELTGVASFLLICDDRSNMRARVAARQALLVTFATGLCLLAGLLLLGRAAGSYRLSAIIAADSAEWIHTPVSHASILLILVGALGKSAQLPFHFWLPAAMAAPTPVSAYLHSATMVKLGIYLCARLDPAFQAWPPWSVLLLGFGWTTMILAGVAALFARQVKAMLAYATVSALGYLLGLYGLENEEIQGFDFVHIGNHALYKACLFMVAGIIIHATGTGDREKLGGLLRRFPHLAVFTAIALASMVGMPGTLGFVSKETIVRGLMPAQWGADVDTLMFVVFALGIALKTAFALRFFTVIFPGGVAGGHRSDAKADPSPLFLAAPVLLAATLLVLGIAPHVLMPLVETWALQGSTFEPDHVLAAWSGFNREFVATTGMLVAGVALHAALSASGAYRRHLPKAAQLDRLHERFLEWLTRLGRASMRAIQVDRPTAYVPVILGALIPGGVAAAVFSYQVHEEPFSVVTPPWLRVIAGVLIISAAIGVVFLGRWTTRVISLSATGFLVCFYFVLFRAPDLALTQILVETITLLLVLLLLARFPKAAEAHDRRRRRATLKRCVNGAIAVAFGLGTTATLLFVASPFPAHRMGGVQLAHSVEAGLADNVVSGIITSFRGLDTLGESSVLLAALFAAIGLLMRHRRQTSGAQTRAHTHARRP